MGISDLISQIFEYKGNYKKFDLTRTGKMALLGGFTNGICLTRWYRLIDDRFHKKIIYKIIADQLVYAPASISFFLVTTKKGDCSLNGYRSYFNYKFIDIWKSDCLVWPMSNYLNFKYIPVHRQPIFTSCVDLGWNTYMSYFLHKATKKKNHN